MQPPGASAIAPLPRAVHQCVCGSSWGLGEAPSRLTTLPSDRDVDTIAFSVAEQSAFRFSCLNVSASVR